MSKFDKILNPQIQEVWQNQGQEIHTNAHTHTKEYHNQIAQNYC